MKKPRSHASGYPRQRCEHVVLNPLPHVEYVISVEGHRMAIRQTGLANISTTHRNARIVLGAAAVHKVDYRVYCDERGKYGFVPKGGAVPASAPMSPAPTPEPMDTEATPAQWRGAFNIVAGQIDPETNRYPQGVSDQSLAELHALPVGVISKTRLQFFGEPLPNGPSEEDLIALRDDASRLAFRHMALAVDAEAIAARASAVLGGMAK